MIQSIFNFDNINFNGGNISCDGGSILLLSFLKKYNLLSSLDDIPFNDTRRLPKYSNSDIITQIVLRNLYKSQDNLTNLLQLSVLNFFRIKFIFDSIRWTINIK